MRLAPGVLFALAMAHCAPRAQRPAAQTLALPPAPAGRVVARVGAEAITAPELLAYARAHALTDPRAALERMVRERLLSLEAQRRRLDRDPLFADTARRDAIQRLFVTALERDPAVNTIPDAEFEEAFARRSFPLLHGPLARTQHLVTQVPLTAPAAEHAHARARMEELRTRWSRLPTQPDGTHAEAAVRALADEVLAGVPHRFEQLPPVERTGRTATAGFDPGFARAANELTAPGELSPLVQSPFGVHLIELLERVPAVEGDPVRLRASLLEHLRTERRQRALTALLTRLHQGVDPAPTEASLRAVEALRFGGSGP